MSIQTIENCYQMISPLMTYSISQMTYKLIQILYDNTEQHFIDLFNLVLNKGRIPTISVKWRVEGKFIQNSSLIALKKFKTKILDH